MITAIIGHRGTGKTELIQRLRFYLSDKAVEVIDLDAEIEEKIGKTIHELFLVHGEPYFRELEKQMFLEVLQKPHENNMYLVLGAGFDISIIPNNVRVLWIKRKTDLDGRIFLNRPRLNPDISPLEEYKKRAEIREQAYKKRADEIYLMPEGLLENHHHAMAVEKSILNHDMNDIRGGVTVASEVLLTTSRWKLFKDRYSNKGIDFFELRDDLLSFEQIDLILTELPNEKFIYSFRRIQNWQEFLGETSKKEFLNKLHRVDWAYELGAPSAELLSLLPKEKIILSCHEISKFHDWIQFEKFVGHMKFAPEIPSFADLKKGHSWQNEKPESRSFLPRSKNGDWEWYRLYQKQRQLLNFWREGEGSAIDQPSLFNWLMTSPDFKSFAAVLGEPVKHSYTPLEHSDFFHKLKMPVFSISIGRNEWDEALPFLQKLGLTHAAVTSPHKENAAKLCQHKDLKAVNTLYFDKKNEKWLGTSTDEVGFLELIEGIGMISPLQKDIFVWGGGGTLEMLKKALPKATYFSSRTGFPRQPEEYDKNVEPKIVIWAAPRTADTLMPPVHWVPAIVYDLNYKEDSMGREYAQKCGANYQSGLVMFIAQAREQRVFWSHCEENYEC
ncbi:MAG: shikimate kinase [Bdellovibrio sp.]